MDSLQVLQNDESLEVVQIYQKVILDRYLNWHASVERFKMDVCMISLEEKVFWPFRILVLYELKFINSLITILSFVLYLTFTTTRQETEDISIPLVLIKTGLFYIS